MAKFVIAGYADCPYYARAELLGDKLSINLPDFKVHKIVKKEDEWKHWLETTCKDRGWSHGKSPLVWRELIDRGGKGVLIGGANEFQEYAMGYYGQESAMNSTDMRNVAAENLKCKVEIDDDEKVFKAFSNPLHVCITNASSKVCYGLLDSLCRGDVLGEKVEMIVHLYDDAKEKEYLEGLKMEAEDLAYGLLRGIEIESDVKQAFKNCDFIYLLDDISQGEKSKEDWIKENAKLFVDYAKVIDEVANKSVKVLVSGSGPNNFNTYMLIKNAPSISRQNFAALSRQLENQSKAVIAERLKVNSAGVVDLIVWGNPNGQYYIDVAKSRVHGYDGAIVGPDSFSVPGPEMVFDKKWLETDYLELVKNKKTKAEEMMGHPATVSEASAVNSTMKHWVNGSPSGQTFSLGICSDGWYGIPKDMVFSFPVTFHPKGYWSVVQDVDLSDEVKAKIHETIKDLESEIEVIFPRPKPPTPPADSEQAKSDEESKKEGTQVDGEQRLETIVEEKKENSEEEADTTSGTAKSDAEKTETEKSDAEKTEGEKSDAEKTEAEKSDVEKTDGEKTASETGKDEEKQDEAKEEQLPTE